MCAHIHCVDRRAGEVPVRSSLNVAVEDVEKAGLLPPRPSLELVVAQLDSKKGEGSDSACRRRELEASFKRRPTPVDAARGTGIEHSGDLLPVKAGETKMA